MKDIKAEYRDQDQDPSAQDLDQDLENWSQDGLNTKIYLKT